MVPYRWVVEKKESYLGQDWYSTLEGFDGLIVARNVRARNGRASLSSLHSEVEGLVWKMSVWGICVSFRSRLQRIVLSW